MLLRSGTAIPASLAALAVAVGLGGCTATPTTPTPQPVGPTNATTAAVTGDADRSVPGARTELVTGLDSPWGLAFLPDGSALVSSRPSGAVVRKASKAAPASHRSS